MQFLIVLNFEFRSFGIVSDFDIRILKNFHFDQKQLLTELFGYEK